MLTEDDLKFIKDSQSEIRINRQREVDLIIKVVESIHPITKEEITKDVLVPINAVVTVVTASTTVVGNTRKLVEGMEIISGDVIVDIRVEDLSENYEYDKIDSFMYEGNKYKVKSFGRLGLSYPSRIELVGRRVY